MKNLNQFLKKLNNEELEVLQKIVGTKKSTIDEISIAFGKLPLFVGGVFQSSLSYNEILNRIAERNKIEIKNSSSNFEKEKELFQKLFIKEFDQMNTEEKEMFLKKLEQGGLDKSQITSITSIGAIAAAQASGFGIYLLASSTVGAISSALGISLPFAFYTGLSSAIAVAIGPIGFLVLGYLTYKSFKHIKSWDEAKGIFNQSGTEIKNFFAGNMSRTDMAFKYIVSMRILKIKAEEDNVKQVKESLIELNETSTKLKKDKDEINVKVNSLKESIIEIENQIEELKVQRLEKEKEEGELASQNEIYQNKIDSLNEQIEIADQKVLDVLEELKLLKGN